MSIAQSTIVYGVFINVFGIGTLLVGESGIGKSDLALSMVNRGHAFIADDIVEFSLRDKSVLIGRSPKLLRNFLGIRGLGVVDIPAIFGTQAVLQEQALSVVVKLEKPSSLPHSISFDSSPWSLLGVTVPSFSLPLTIFRPREVLLEVLVRNYQSIQKGNHAHMKFIENHDKALSELL